MDPDCISEDEAIRLLQPAPWRRMAVIGDSVAAGIRERLTGYVDECFANRLGEALRASRPDFSFVNLGVRDLRIREIIDTQLPVALDFAPDVALVVAGGNDVLGRTFDPEQIIEDLDDLLEPLAVIGTHIITVGLFDLARSGLLPAEYQAEMVKRFDRLDAITRNAARRVDGLHINTHIHPRSADPSIYASDRIHCNARGHSIAFAAIVHEVAASGRWWPRTWHPEHVPSD